MKVSVTPKLTASATTANSPNMGAHHLPSAASDALSTSDTMSRKPMPRTSPSESRRTRKKSRTPPVWRSAGTCQMRSIAFCSSANTVVAPISSVPRPTRVPITLAAGRSRLLSAAFKVAALSGPTSVEICSKISARAAASPKNRPATEITISSKGATENNV
ncbi:hypothetical protein FQZ97_909130 [compost metagenome]